MNRNLSSVNGAFIFGLLGGTEWIRNGAFIFAYPFFCQDITRPGLRISIPYPDK